NEVKSNATFFRSIQKRIHQLQKHQLRNIYDFDFSIINSLSDILTDEETTIIKKNPQEESEIEDLIKTGKKDELVKRYNEAFNKLVKEGLYDRMVKKHDVVVKYEQ
ncbi:MAG: hypothetical protein C0602_11610, partial [Denitrovibrio sp.]